MVLCRDWSIFILTTWFIGNLFHTNCIFYFSRPHIWQETKQIQWTSCAIQAYATGYVLTHRAAARPQPAQSFSLFCLLLRFLSTDHFLLSGTWRRGTSCSRSRDRSNWETLARPPSLPQPTPLWEHPTGTTSAVLRAVTLGCWRAAGRRLKRCRGSKEWLRWAVICEMKLHWITCRHGFRWLPCVCES